MTDLEMGVLVLALVWLALVDPLVVEPWQRRRRARRARRFEVGRGSKTTTVR